MNFVCNSVCYFAMSDANKNIFEIADNKQDMVPITHSVCNSVCSCVCKNMNYKRNHKRNSRQRANKNEI